MRKKLQSIINKLPSITLISVLFILWQFTSTLEILPAFMLPAPLEVVSTLVREFPVLLYHTRISLIEAMTGLGLGIAAAFLFAIVMDKNAFFYKALYPVLLLTQTVPSIAIAPLLILWMGYGMAPKIALVFLVCFFPMTIGLLNGFRNVDPDAVKLLNSMGATSWQQFVHIQIPFALPGFFAGLKTSAAYSIVGAVIAEWLGGSGGLGVYMTRVRTSYAFDKMFAVIIWISLLTLLLMGLTMLLEKKIMSWREE